MRLIGELVSCSLHGFGRIVEQTDDCIRIAFFTDGETCRFRLPHCFLKELVLEDPLTRSVWIKETSGETGKSYVHPDTDLF